MSYFTHVPFLSLYSSLSGKEYKTIEMPDGVMWPYLHVVTTYDYCLLLMICWYKNRAYITNERASKHRQKTYQPMQ